MCPDDPRAARLESIRLQMWVWATLRALRAAERLNRHRDHYAGWMDDYTALADKLATDSKHLDTLLQKEPDEETLPVAIGVAKRVRRTSTMLVQQLAALRDTKRQP